jgi:hypothetical protein
VSDAQAIDMMAWAQAYAPAPEVLAIAWHPLPVLPIGRFALCKSTIVCNYLKFERSQLSVKAFGIFIFGFSNKSVLKNLFFYSSIC